MVGARHIRGMWFGIGFVATAAGGAAPTRTAPAPARVRAEATFRRMTPEAKTVLAHAGRGKIVAIG